MGCQGREARGDDRAAYVPPARDLRIDVVVDAPRAADRGTTGRGTHVPARGGRRARGTGRRRRAAERVPAVPVVAARGRPPPVPPPLVACKDCALNMVEFGAAAGGTLRRRRRRWLAPRATRGRLQQLARLAPQRCPRHRPHSAASARRRAGSAPCAANVSPETIYISRRC